MRTILETPNGTIVGEDMNSHCVRVTIEGRRDLGSVILNKDVSELEEGEIAEAGESLLGREMTTEFGTFILKGNKLSMRGREGIYDVEDTEHVQDHLYSIYNIMWKDDIERELRQAAKKKKPVKEEHKKSSFSLI